MNFDEIRPYHDDELPVIYEGLIADPMFRQMATLAFPAVPFDTLAQQMRACRTKLAFQKAFCYPILKRIAREHTDSLSLDRSASAAQEKACLYISNHRDIILDSGFLDILLVDQEMDTVEIAIGDNLLIYPWIKKLVRINKSFIVQRNLPMRQMLESSVRLSTYIRRTIAEENRSIWIAQREGRAKDSDDRTQESILKMLTMSGAGDTIDRLTELNIVPLSLSYEYDPCDFLKAKEFQQKRDILDFKKTPQDDLTNMQTGLLGDKGHVFFRTTPCINNELAQIDRTLPKQELFAAAAALIDRHIHANYRLYPGNYAAHDALTGTQRFACHYTADERTHFLAYIDSRIERIDLPSKDVPFLREQLLRMYANPLTNYLAATRSPEPLPVQ
ncbi:MAG: 1-acyl-sn-glycerol-3-phosphate acyltransferase [Prevotellaceae bacterium]|jgi:hypothetical protein|nr:1-acyl-sn-glycerol-3-phosphate acyltransferase [Prevotellaceae bacterium]